jgi:hypothetical protein
MHTDKLRHAKNYVLNSEGLRTCTSVKNLNIALLIQCFLICAVYVRKYMYKKSHYLTEPREHNQAQVLKM